MVYIFSKEGYGEDHSYFYSYTQTRSVEDDLIDDTSTNKILPLMSNKSKILFYFSSEVLVNNTVSYFN